MFAPAQLSPAFRRLIQVQYGVLTREQAVGVGLTRAVIRRLVDSERWRVLEPGLYLDLNVGMSWHAQAWAGTLLGRDGARLSGHSAAYLHKINDDQPLPIEVLVPWSRRIADREWVRFGQERGTDRRISVGSPPRTHAVDTVLDLCADGTAADAVGVVTRAVQRQIVTPSSLRRALRGRSRITHRRVLEDLIADTSIGVHSHLERRYLHDVERAHRLPAADRQFAVVSGGGHTDALYQRFAMVIELDGEQWHRDRRHLDRARDNAHSRQLGVLTLRFGWPEVAGTPCPTAAEVAFSMRDRGWDGRPTPCSSVCGVDRGW